jgi:hypothetical protein
MNDDLNIETYVRKPFTVYAVQVTADNVEAVAAWCGGELDTKPATPKFPETRYVKVPVKRPLTHRQTLAYPGDWVLDNGTGFKVYTQNAFAKSFDKTETE